MAEEELSFGDEIGRFVDHVDSLKQTLPLLMVLIQQVQLLGRQELDEFVKESRIESQEGDSEKTYLIPREHISTFRQLDKELKKSIIAGSVVPRTFAVSLVSQFDAFLGRLIRLIFIKKPDLLRASEKQFTFSNLMEFSSLDEAREYVIEQEIQSVLRDSHAKQFKWLEAKVGMTLTKELPSWPSFIELTERRNLFVHSDGVVTSQYLKVCANHSVQFDEKVEPGTKLPVDPDYFRSANECIFEIGVKLGQVLWRKLEPEDLEKADSNLLDICYELICNKSYNLALKLLHFGVDVLKKHSSEEMKLLLVLNKAQALRWSGKPADCMTVLDSVDWSAKDYKFRLGMTVLRDNWDEAVRLMQLIGKDNQEIGPTEYRDWPIFSEFRKTDQFRDIYLDIYGSEFRFAEQVNEADDDQSE